MSDEEDENVPCDVCSTTKGHDRYAYVGGGDMVFCHRCFVAFRYVNAATTQPVELQHE